MSMDRSTRVVRGAVLCLVAYWLLYSLLAAVNVTDAQTYNQARLYVIDQGGLFENHIAHTSTQISFPWTYDAVHWPFVVAGFGHALPSYCCLVGILLITYRLVCASEGPACAWVACLGLLALPALVYQGTSTKNDIPVVFGALCWFYAMRRFAKDGRRLDLLASAVAIAFTGGVKSHGLALVPFMVLTNVWALRRQRRTLARWLGMLMVAGALLLSVETYVASRLSLGHWLGVGTSLRNRDGVAGAVANIIRYTLHNLDTGVDALLHRKTTLTVRTEEVCRWVLGELGLANRGYMTARFDDSNLDFLKGSHEAQAGYGPFGTLSLLLLPVALVRRRPGELAWTAAAASVLVLGTISYTTGHFPYNNRFLLLPFALAAIASTLLSCSWWHRSRAVRVGWLILLLFGAIVLPWQSFNRGPRHLWSWVSSRDEMITREAPSYLPALTAVRRNLAACPSSVWLVTAAPFSWEFLFYDALRDHAVISRRDQLTSTYLADIRRRYPGRTIYVLAINQTLDQELNLTELEALPQERPAVRLYRLGPDLCRGT